ncbi:DNA/RNA non-specific endonuclease [Jiangella endophytica]|uniref:DNA/RNA non-specific endonuclease n=1 Tax=Jiangella endophytica TaxID=1623398 RepID=UPI000E35360E|nr:DNA/RNA non-specific endonuclease [Jiangella endophytica]
MSDRPINDASEGLSELRDSDVPEAADIVSTSQRDHIEAVRRLVDQARRHVDARTLRDLETHQRAIEAEARSIGDEVSAVASGVLNELRDVTRHQDIEAANIAAVLIQRPNPPAAQTAPKRPEIHVSSTDPSYAKLLGNPPPMTDIVVDKAARYSTDEHGRVIRAEATLPTGPPGRRKRYSQSSLKGKRRGDDAGHLIADIFGGIGDRLNLVPMGRTVNRSEYAALEIQWRKAIALEKSVDFEVELQYDDDGRRPSWLSVTYKIEGEQSQTVDIENLPEETP